MKKKETIIRYVDLECKDFNKGVKDFNEFIKNNNFKVVEKLGFYGNNNVLASGVFRKGKPANEYSISVNANGTAEIKYVQKSNDAITDTQISTLERLIIAAFE